MLNEIRVAGEVFALVQRRATCWKKEDFYTATEARNLAQFAVYCPRHVHKPSNTQFATLWNLPFRHQLRHWVHQYTDLSHKNKYILCAPTNFKLPSKIKGNSKDKIYVSSGHCDYAPRTTNNLATPLTVLIVKRKF
jgi:hypothetical protein